MIPLLQKQLQGTQHKLVAMPGINHRLQQCQTGALAEYATIKETVAPNVLQVVSDWIISIQK
jgi:hypothetical protein